MRDFFCLAVLGMALTGCSNRQTETTSTTDSSATAQTESITPTTASGEQCYRQVTGRDTTTLRLTVNGADVTGELAVLPYEKDQATGPIRGTLTNGAIKADWQRSGEGTTQPYEVDFTMKGDTVMWREGERVEKAGKWVLKSPNEGYQYVVVKSDCQ